MIHSLKLGRFTTQRPSVSVGGITWSCGPAHRIWNPPHCCCGHDAIHWPHHLHFRAGPWSVAGGPCWFVWEWPLPTWLVMGHGFQPTPPQWNIWRACWADCPCRVWIPQGRWPCQTPPMWFMVPSRFLSTICPTGLATFQFPGGQRLTTGQLGPYAWKWTKLGQPR